MGFGTQLQHSDSRVLALLDVMPYLWVNHWIVAITYLHHTHPEVPKYEPEAWTFYKGATATIDRELGFGGKHLMHNIAEFQSLGGLHQDERVSTCTMRDET